MKRPESKCIVVFLTCLLLLRFTGSAMAWPDWCKGVCCDWDGWDCITTSCSPCYSCVSCSCVWDCSPGQTCCNGTCCDNPCCGTECCRENQYCCGNPAWNELCCNEDEVCCWYFDGGVFTYYCNPPCWDEVTDTTTCSEDNEEHFECIHCLNRTDGPCTEYTYRDYTGLQIKECYDGCPQFDYSISNEICYEERYCVGELKTLHMCMECDEGIFCIDCDSGGEICECGDDNLGCAVTVTVCELIINCWDCDEGGPIVSTVRRETCSCQ